MPRLQIIVGGQLGSEAKGHVAGYLARPEHSETPLAIRVGGPNAGHSVVDPHTGLKYALRHIPVAAVTNPAAKLAIAAGSEIDLPVLHSEIELLESAGIEVTSRLYVDPRATILEQHHHYRERQLGLSERVGSTGKGVGAARADRLMREATIARDWAGSPGTVTPVGALAADRRWSHIQIEGVQGYGLGLHAGYYPHCTSTDCTALASLAAAEINPWDHSWPQIYLVFRPYPIRVAGNSGPLHQETDWDELGLPAELTTVTQKVRRVGRWDPELAAAAVRANDGHRNNSTLSPLQLVLTMADQLDPALAGVEEPAALAKSELYRDFVSDNFEKPLGATPVLVTTSDRTCVDLR